MSTDRLSAPMMMMMMDLSHEHHPLLVFASFVLEPDPDNSGAESGHLHQLVLDQSVRSRVESVADPQQSQLMVIQNGPHSSRPWLRLQVVVVAVVT